MILAQCGLEAVEVYTLLGFYGVLHSPPLNFPGLRLDPFQSRTSKNICLVGVRASLTRDVSKEKVIT